MRGVGEVEGALGVFTNPHRVVGGVVEDDVANAEHVPLVSHLAD